MVLVIAKSITVRRLDKLPASSQHVRPNHSRLHAALSTDEDFGHAVDLGVDEGLAVVVDVIDEIRVGRQRTG